MTKPAVSETPETDALAKQHSGRPEKTFHSASTSLDYAILARSLERRLREAEAKLGEAVELERMRLAAISVATLMNSRHSEPPLQRDHVYWTQSYQDTLDAVGREIEWRERAEAAERGAEGG